MGSELLDKFGVQYREGAVIFREGDHGDEMFIIHDGEVQITKKAKNAEHILATLRTGDFFGEMALFTTSSRSATVTAKRKSTILKIDKNSFDFMVRNNVPFAIEMIRKLCERLLAADVQISELLELSQETRILRSMLEYWKFSGKKDKSGEILLLPYDGFLDYLHDELEITEDKAKVVLVNLKNRDIVHVKKDTHGNLYLSFSPRVFQYFNII